MTVRYVVEQLPRRGLTAFTPTLTRPGIVAFRGLTHVVGYPGTLAVSSPAPGLPVASEDPATAPSNVAPDVIAPDVYLALTDNMGPWAPRGCMHTRTGDNEVPVSNPGPIRVTPNAFRPAKIGGRKVIGWPRALTSWPAQPGTGGGA